MRNTVHRQILRSTILVGISWAALAGCQGNPAKTGTIIPLNPGVKHVGVPPGGVVVDFPPSLPGTITDKGTKVAVTVRSSGGGIISGVPVVMEITAGQDKIITSQLDGGEDPTSTATPNKAHYVDTKITSYDERQLKVPTGD
ncbi:MAG: hypothetical protein OK436_07810, partial [Thaumarchaeota archaeon]|nr:hypothetical protein [Nitrososphaerota archaeon]